MHLKNAVLNGLLASLSPTLLLLVSSCKLLFLFCDKLYERINELIFATYMRVYLFFFEYIAVNKVYLYGDIDFWRREQDKILYIANHLSTSDWFLCSMLLARQGNLGRSRFLLHKNLKYIPIFGYCLSQSSCIFVDRANFQAEKAKKVLRKLREVQSKTWLVIYPEGTRYNPEHKDVIKKSQEFATKNGLIPYRHVLTPRTRGFQLLMANMHDYLDALYDVTVIYADEHGRPLDCRIRVPQMTHWFHQCHTLHIHLTRIPMNIIPKEPKQLNAWLFDRFRIKDDFLESVQNTFYGSSEKSTHSDEVNRVGENGCVPVSSHPNTHPRGDISIERTIEALIPPQLSKRMIELPPLSFLELLPSIVFFYGITFYWIFGFGWYGPLSFIVFSVLGTLAGEVYVHYAV